MQPAEPPRNYAPRGIAALLAPVVRPAFRRRAPAAAHLLTDWDELAGPQLAALAAPVKLAGGTLTLACSGAAAMELQYVVPQIIGRLNRALGHETVERLRFVQIPAAALPPTPIMPPSTACAPPEGVPDGLPDGPLGEALAKLYHGIKARG